MDFFRHQQSRDDDDDDGDGDGDDDDDDDDGTRLWNLDELGVSSISSKEKLSRSTPTVCDSPWSNSSSKHPWASSFALSLKILKTKAVVLPDVVQHKIEVLQSRDLG